MAREQLKVTSSDAALKLFSSREELAAALANRIAGKLTEAISLRGTAFLAVSGGTTPARFFQALSKAKIEWSKVTVTLVDERMVPPQSDRSNERLVRSALLQNEAKSARFIGLYSSSATAAAATAKLASQAWPLDAAVLGMGGDGHTASFFPDARNLDVLLDPANVSLVEAVDAPGAGEPRLTLPLARLVEASLIVLHIEGPEKRKVLEAALTDQSELPIASVMRAAPSAIQVYWSS